MRSVKFLIAMILGAAVISTATLAGPPPTQPKYAVPPISGVRPLLAPAQPKYSVPPISAVRPLVEWPKPKPGTASKADPDFKLAPPYAAAPWLPTPPAAKP